MKMNLGRRYDVIIVGAGPAGSTSGKILAESGSKVLIVDKASFPREKICGGLITEKTLKLLKSKLKISDFGQVIQSKKNGFEIYNKKDFKNRITAKQGIYFVLRKSFDYYLLQRAIKAGCAFIEGSEVKEFSDSSITINDITYHYNYLIGADGVHSVIRKRLGKALNKKNVGFGLRTEIPISSLNNYDIDMLPKIYFSYLEYGWGWIFPKGESISIGIGGLGRKQINVRDVFYNFVEDIGFSNLLNSANVKGGYVPYGSFLRKPAKNNVFLIGDAAGFADPVTGEGIYFALLSGILAAEAINSNNMNKEKEYITKCKKHIFRYIRQGIVARILLFREPFKTIAMNRFKKQKKYMVKFMEVLSGDLDYVEYFRSIILG